MQNLFEEGDISIRDYRPQYDHPEPIILSDVDVHRDMKDLVENSGLNLSEYRVFAVLRNPYDRIISRAFYRPKGACRNIFDARKILAKGYVDEDDKDWPQSAFFKYNGEVRAEIWHYSEISDTLPAFVRSYGKEPIHPLLNLKSDHTPPWAKAETILTPSIKQKIDEVFAEDVELFNRYGKT
jgi:hypothetical protein